MKNILALSIILLATQIGRSDYKQGIEASRSGDYDTALPLLIKAEPTVPIEARPEFYFYKAVAEYELLKKSEAQKSLSLLLNLEKLPLRYKRVGEAMEDDLKGWDANPLKDVARHMGEVGRRLALAKAGPETQKKQKNIVDKLDKLIKEKEDEAAKARAAAQAKADAENISLPGQAGGVGNRAQESNIAGGDGKGIIDDKKLEALGENWGQLPEATRKKIELDIIRDIPVRYRPMVENYYRSLNTKGKK
jgi:hypothetical protein